MAVSLTAAAACSDSSPPQVDPAGHGVIESIWLYPYPEGPQVAFFRHPTHPKAGEQSLSEVANLIPRPLPEQVSQGRCSTGGFLDVHFQDGAVLQYGPCHRPLGIEHLIDGINKLMRQAEKSTQD